MRKHRLIRQIRIELVGRFGSHCSIVPHNLDTTIATIGCTSGPTFGVKFGDGLICGIDRKNKGPDFRPAPEVTRFIRLHLRRSEGQCGQLGGRCSHRTASKTSMPTLNEQRNLLLQRC